MQLNTRETELGDLTASCQIIDKKVEENYNNYIPSEIPLSGVRVGCTQTFSLETSNNSIQ